MKSFNEFIKEEKEKDITVDSKVLKMGKHKLELYILELIDLLNTRFPSSQKTFSLKKD